VRTNRSGKWETAATMRYASPDGSRFLSSMFDSAGSYFVGGVVHGQDEHAVIYSASPAGVLDLNTP